LYFRWALVYHVKEKLLRIIGTYALGLFPIDMRKQAMMIEARKYYQQITSSEGAVGDGSATNLDYRIEVLDV
jgi:hypothetical protein